MSEKMPAPVNDEIDQLLGVTPSSEILPASSQLGAEGLLPLVSRLAEVDFREEIRPRMDLKQAWERQVRLSSSRSDRRFAGIRKPTWVMLVTAISIFVFVMLLIGPGRVVAAFQKLIGFIPGIGFVQTEDTVLVLDAPIEIIQEGVTITVENAVSDGQATRMNLHVKGISNPARFDEQGSQTRSGLALQLSNGEQLALKGYQITFRPTFTLRFDFAPLPSGTEQAVLLFTSIPGLPAGAAPENWQIPLSFQPGEVDTQIEAATGVMVESRPVSGVILKLLNISQSDQETALQVQVAAVNELVFAESWDDQLVLKDGQGHFVPFIGRQLSSPVDRNSVTFTTPALDPGQEMVLELKGPVRLFERVPDLQVGPEFTFDPGQDAVIGQTWALDETLQVAGRTIHLKGVQLIKGLNGQPELLFKMTPQEDVVGAMFSTDASHAEVVGTGNLRLILNAVPKKTIVLRVHGIYYQVEGHWKIRWEMPE